MTDENQCPTCGVVSDPATWLRSAPEDDPGCHQHGGWHHHGGFKHSSGAQHDEADHTHATTRDHPGLGCEVCRGKYVLEELPEPG